MSRYILTLISATFICFLSFQVTASTREIIIPDKTPSDIYQLLLTLEKQVIQLRDERDVFDAWPRVSSDDATNRAPRHVLQKSIEVLEKINRLRQIRNLGPITITAYPSRYITPNEVYDSVNRLLKEVEYILKNTNKNIEKTTIDKTQNIYTPSDAYKKLWEISLAIDPLLGIRGFSPSDVYAQAKYVNQRIRFLRLSQNLPDNIPQPPRPENRHPNHALKAAYNLLDKISTAEHNLWMQPEQVPTVPRRVIRPTEVYDALQIVIAELKRIQFRLGIERDIPMPAIEPGKSPSDVVQMLTWAADAMPQFAPGQVLYQYDQNDLTRRPADVLEVARDIEAGLIHYQQQRGIPARQQRAPLTEGLAPKHVYQKTLTNLNKVARLRQQTGLGHTVVPDYPLRAITPGEVHELAVRLRDELDLVYSHSGVTPEKEAFNHPGSSFEVTPSHVYRQMWDISGRLDSILGTTGYSTRDLYQETLRINQELVLLIDHLGRTSSLTLPPLRSQISTDQILIQAQQVLAYVASAQQRAGLVRVQIPRPAISGQISVGDLFNTVEVIRTELVTLKVQLGLTHTVTATSESSQDISLNQVYQQLELAQNLIQQRLLEE